MHTAYYQKMYTEYYQKCTLHIIKNAHCILSKMHTAYYQKMYTEYYQKCTLHNIVTEKYYLRETEKKHIHRIHISIRFARTRFEVKNW